MEQQFFIREMKAHFNLREPKSDKPTPIYMVVRIGKKQLKLPIGCKIYPAQWNQKTERAFISPMLSELDNQNNFIVNAKISHFLLLFSQFLKYICNEPQNISDMESKLKESMSKGKRTKAVKKENAIRWLYLDLEKAVMKERSKTEYEQQIKDFERFCKATNRVPLQWKDITYNLIMEYQEWLMSTPARVNSKRDDRTVGGKISKLITRLKKAEKAGFIDLYKSRVHLYEKPKVAYQSQDNTFALYEKEIHDLLRLKLTGDLEKVRDVFVFQLWSGQRFSDLPNLNRGIIDRENKKIKIVQDKETEGVTVPIFPIALEILNKYDWNLPLFKLDKTNEIIKEVAQRAKLTREHYVTRQHRGEVKTEKRMICDDLASHCARRTFITLMMKKKLLTREEIKAISGHRTDSAFNRYIKLDKDEVADEALRIFYGEDYEKQQPQQVQSVPVTSSTAQSTTPDYNYIEQKVREKVELENKVKEQERTLSTMHQRIERQSEELTDYQDAFSVHDYIDKIGDLTIQAEQDSIFLYGEKP